ncbi:hypothetical protein [Kitasatospora sp. HPMI-4]|uniref:hypothetical protein n=1 Tax=Kitasatospora sp. HPMI-4 TaxID=3448443 RepID=UPI003F1BDB3F
MRLAQTWGGADRLLDQCISTSADAVARVLQQRSFTYRPDGRLTEIADAAGGSRSFDLDASGRITAVTGGNWQEAYAYDQTGHIIQAAWPERADTAEESTAGARAYAGALLQRAGRTHYEYDGQGRLVRQTRQLLSGGVRVWQYTWDADDRLVSLTTPSGEHWRYLYDPFGRRVAKYRMDADGTNALEQTVFVWDGTVLAEQVHTDFRTGTVQTTTWTGSRRSTGRSPRRSACGMPHSARSTGAST